MKQRHLIPALLLGLGIVPSFACAGTSERTASSSDRVEDSCIYFDETKHSVCDSEHGRFKSTFEKFGLAAIGYPLTDVYPDGKGDWYQAFERVDMNGNYGKGCEEGRACIAQLGRWDLENVKHWSVGSEQVTDCGSDAIGPRTNEICLPRDFLENNYYKNGGLEFYGHMLSRVYDNCELYPNKIAGQCFWTERAKVGRIYGRNDWEGEQLGRKKIELEGTVNGGPPAVDPPIPTDPRMKLSETTIYLPSDTPGLGNYQAGAGVATVCRTADPTLVAQLERFRPGNDLQGRDATVIVQTGPKSWETRMGHSPNPFELVTGCPNNDGFKIYLYEWSPNFLGDFDMAGAFVKEMQLGAFTCGAAVKIDKFALDVKRFAIEDGKLKKPAITVTFGGTPIGQGDIVNCEVEKKTSLLYTQVGIVPLVYELYVSFGVSLAITNGSRFQATVGTEDGVNFWIENDPSAGTQFVLTPQMRLGVTFYKAASAYVGLNLPITATAKPGCTNEYKVGGQLVVGAELGGDLSGGNVLQAEWTSQPLVERILRPASCQ